MPRRARAWTVFPDPDSPRIARTSPRSSVYLIPSTARSGPRSLRKSTWRPSTSRSRCPFSLATSEHPGVERVAKRLAEEYERPNQNAQEQRREEQQVGVVEELVLRDRDLQ